MTEPCLNRTCRYLLWRYMLQALGRGADVVANSRAEWRVHRCGQWLDEVRAIDDQAEAISRRMAMRLLREQGA